MPDPGRGQFFNLAVKVQKYDVGDGDVITGVAGSIRRQPSIASEGDDEMEEGGEASEVPFAGVDAGGRSRAATISLEVCTR